MEILTSHIKRGCHINKGGDFFRRAHGEILFFFGSKREDFWLEEKKKGILLFWEEERSTHEKGFFF